MLREIGWEQFLEWMDFDRLEPIGGQRGDWQAASICSIIANLEMIKHGRKKRFRTKDFLLEFKDDEPAAAATATAREEEPPEVPNWQAMKMIARMQVALANADEKRKQQRKGRR